MRRCSLAFAVLIAAGASAQQSRHGFVIGRVVQPDGHLCITPETRAEALARIAAYEARFGPLSTPAADGAVLYRFYPQAGNYAGDLLPPGFVDVDPSPSVTTYECHPFTYNGHTGIDTPIRSFDYQSIGVPVFAAADGVVVVAVDGEPDMNTACIGAGNYVIIDHGMGREGWYFHLKKNSVAVTVGQPVVAGQQIGMTASSGCSFGPHLHFESRQNGTVYEPFAGACRPGTSGWASQPPLDLENLLADFGVTSTDLNTVPGLPFAMPTHAQITTSDPYLYFWLLTVNLPAQATWRVIIRNPANAIVHDSGNVPFQNPELWRQAWFWWYYDVPFFFGTLGTHTIELRFSGKTMIIAPVEIVTQATPGFNRPPDPIAVAFDPPAPESSDVVFCRVDSSLVLDDLDWDLVRYRYVWEVAGAVVRDVVTAAMSDAIPAGTGAPGDPLRCTVTPSDGKADGPAVVVTTTFAGPCYADCDQSGTLDLFDFLCFVNEFNSGNPYADCDNSGTLDLFDFLCFVNAFNAGCP